MPKLASQQVVLDPDAKSALSAIHPTVESFLADGAAPWLRKALDACDLRQDEEVDPQERALNQLVRYVDAEISPQPLSGTLLLEQLRDSLRLLPTGSNNLDELLRGGLKEGQVTELCGESGSGKTLLCHVAAVTTAQRAEHVLYIDTTNSFSAQRCADLHAQHAQQQDPSAPAPFPAAVCQVLSHITVVRPHSVHELLKALDSLNHALSKGDSSLPKPSLVIVDSVSAVVAPVLGGQGHYHGHALMVEAGRRMKAAADAGRLAVVATNHVVSAGQGGGQGAHAGGGAGVKPALGEHWRRQPHVRVQLTPASSLLLSGSSHTAGPMQGAAARDSDGLVCLSVSAAVMTGTREHKWIRFRNGGVEDVA